MNSFDKVYKLVSLIPKGKVVTYKQISQITGINPRVVGFALHANKNPKTVPCHRVVNIKGQLAKSYAYGGEKAQKARLEKEGIKFLGGAVNLPKHQHLL